LTRRSSETVVAMGMAKTLATRWQHLNDRYRTSSTEASDVTGSFGSATKVIRMLLQSVMLGLGAYLVIRQELSAGAMIASSIMMGRALAPIEIAIGNWRALTTARQSLLRLATMLGKLPAVRARTDLPRPMGRFDVEHVAVAAPGGNGAILSDVHFALSAGEAVAVVGPSAAGKTSLIRTLTGVWPAARGKIRLDGAALEQWDEEALGSHIGYVPQHVEFFEGTIAENIARMSLMPDSHAVLAAGRAAGAHDMILRLPAGYDTKIGDASTVLSAGQRQRIALARALYGDPFLIVLDEPNANLDSEGETALHKVLGELKARGAIVVIISHRPAALEQCDKILVLSNGTQQAFGPRDAVLRKTPAPRPAVAGNLALVRQNDEEIGS
jgi:ATP-binding cassette subfamily C protein